MNNLATQQIREILGSKIPDEATLWCEDTKEFVTVYCRGGCNDMEYFYAAWDGKAWIEYDMAQFTLHDLSDLRRIVELEDKQEKILEIIKAVAYIGVSNDLTHSWNGNSCYDIMSVKRNGEVIWERESKPELQQIIEKLKCAVCTDEPIHLKVSSAIAELEALEAKRGAE